MHLAGIPVHHDIEIGFLFGVLIHHVAELLRKKGQLRPVLLRKFVGVAEGADGILDFRDILPVDLLEFQGLDVFIDHIFPVDDIDIVIGDLDTVEVKALLDLCHDVGAGHEVLVGIPRPDGGAQFDGAFSERRDVDGGPFSLRVISRIFNGILAADDRIMNDLHGGFDVAVIADVKFQIGAGEPVHIAVVVENLAVHDTVGDNHVESVEAVDHCVADGHIPDGAADAGILQHQLVAQLEGAADADHEAGHDIADGRLGGKTDDGDHQSGTAEQYFAEIAGAAAEDADEQQSGDGDQEVYQAVHELQVYILHPQHVVEQDPVCAESEIGDGSGQGDDQESCQDICHRSRKMQGFRKICFQGL